MHHPLSMIPVKLKLDSKPMAFRRDFFSSTIEDQEKAVGYRDWLKPHREAGKLNATAFKGTKHLAQQGQDSEGNQLYRL